MAEYIKREAVINEIEGTTWYHINCQKNLVEGAACEADALYKATDIYNVIKSVPAADVVEVKHGEWVEDGYDDIHCICSCCGAEAQYTSTFEETFDYDWEENLCSTGYEETREYIRTPFCPNCGAKMDGKEIGED